MKRVGTGIAAVLIGAGAALVAAGGAAEARGGRLASFGPEGYARGLRVDVRQTVIVRQVVPPAFGVIAAAGIRRAPIGAPALYVIEPAPRSASPGRSIRRGALPPEVVNGTGEIEPPVREIRIPRR